MKKYILLLLLLAFATTYQAGAQTVSSYSVNLPACVLEKAAKVYVEGFKYTGTGTGDTGFSKKLSANIKSNLTSGYNAKILAMIPWAKNQLYTVVDNAGEATHIVYGDFNHSATAPVSSTETNSALITDEEHNGLYVHYLTFTEKADLNFTGNIKVKKADGTEIYSYTFGKKTVAAKESKFVPASSPLDTKQSISALGADVANSGIYTIMGIGLTNQNYKLASVKISTKDKASKKKIKALNKSIKKTLKSNRYDAKTAGKYYTEILSIEESANTKHNIGVCYLAIGNLTKAKEYFVASGASTAFIDQQIEVQQKLKSLGVQIVENEF
jgi:hypothetical protein